MKFYDYLKSKRAYLISLIVIEAIVLGVLLMLGVGAGAIAFVESCILASFAVPIACEYAVKYSFYSNLVKRVKRLDRKTLIHELVEEPAFLEGRIAYHAIESGNKSMNDEIAVYRRQSNEYMEYINLWVHEIKTPIAVAKLIGSNNPSQATKSMLEELDKTEKFVEQVLYYSKSFTANYDFNIETCDLDRLINTVIKENARLLIGQDVKIEKRLDGAKAYTDRKWLEFILKQLITNSLQFMDKEEKVLRFYASENEDKISLHIRDNGIGIPQRDVGKVFLKGFVGANGRRVGKSTGFGLYICKRLCDSLNIGISIDSIQDQYTTINLEFTKNPQ